MSTKTDLIFSASVVITGEWEAFVVMSLYLQLNAPSMQTLYFSYIDGIFILFFLLFLVYLLPDGFIIGGFLVIRFSRFLVTICCFAISYTWSKKFGDLNYFMRESVS